MYTLQRAFIKVTSYKQQLEQSCGRYCENNDIIVIMPGGKHHPSTTAVRPTQKFVWMMIKVMRTTCCWTRKFCHGLDIAGLRTLLIPLKYLKNIHCMSRSEMPNFLPFPDVPVQMFSEESLKEKLFAWKAALMFTVAKAHMQIKILF